MKGLILKDLYMTRKYFRSYLLILAVFLAVSLVQADNLFFCFYPFLICAMIPVNLLQTAEREHWEKLGNAKKVSSTKVVPATRGNIYDEEGNLLASSIPQQRIRSDCTGVDLVGSGISVGDWVTK